jgi:hypothetical protein
MLVTTLSRSCRQYFETADIVNGVVIGLAYEEFQKEGKVKKCEKDSILQ